MSPDGFISLICHDLRGPMRRLRMLPDWAREEAEGAFGSVPPSLDDLFSRMQSQASHMDALICDLARYARLARSEQAPCTSADAILPEGALVPGITVELDPCELPIEAEHGALVVRCFVENARQHGAAEQTGARLALSNRPDRFEISISDRGPGIEQQFLETVFEPLRTLKPRSVSDGTGMGLAMVARVAALYHGEATAQHNPEGGMLFRFSCPKRVA